MARGRMLNKTICSSAKFHRLPDDTCRLLATWTIAHLDIRGVFSADPVLVKSLVFPRRDDVTSEQVRGYLDAMEFLGLIVRFDTNGDSWQQWPGFGHNQVGIRYDRELPEYPPPPGYVQAELLEQNSEPEKCREKSGKKPAEEKLREVKLKEVNGGADAPAPRHPAIDIYRVKAHCFPDKAQWPAINATVGTDESSLAFWGQVIEAYIMLGWNKRNVGAMLDFYRRHELPRIQTRQSSSRVEAQPDHPVSSEDVAAEYRRMNPHKAKEQK